MRKRPNHPAHVTAARLRFRVNVKKSRLGRQTVTGHVHPKGFLMNFVKLIKLNGLMERSAGRPDIVVGLIDGPVAIDHADLATAVVREVPGQTRGACTRHDRVACQHGTFVAGCP